MLVENPQLHWVFKRVFYLVARLDPGREESPLLGLVPEILVQVGVSDLLQRLHVIHGDEVAVHVRQLHVALLERPGAD